MGPSALDQIAAMIQSCRSNQEIKISRGGAILRIERINGLLDPIQLPRETAQEPIPEAPLELIADLNYEEEQEQLFMDEAA